MSHEKVVCHKCGKVVRQCRCMDHYKVVIHVVCEDCKAKEDTPLISEMGGPGD